MGRLAVYKFAYFLSILFTIFILGLSIFAYFSGKINPVENMFAAYVALSKPYTGGCQYDIIYLLAHQTTVLVMDSIDGSDSKLRIHHFHVPNL